MMEVVFDTNGLRFGFHDPHSLSACDSTACRQSTEGGTLEAARGVGEDSLDGCMALEHISLESAAKPRKVGHQSVSVPTTAGVH
jgi:hypothetical protein